MLYQMTPENSKIYNKQGMTKIEVKEDTFLWGH